MAAWKSFGRSAVLMCVAVMAFTSAAFAYYCELSRDLSFCSGSSCTANYDGTCSCY